MPAMLNRFDGIPVCVSSSLIGPDCAVWMDGKIQVSQELFDRMADCESQEELKALLDGLKVLNFGDGFMKEPLFVGIDWGKDESERTSAIRIIPDYSEFLRPLLTRQLTLSGSNMLGLRGSDSVSADSDS